MDLLTAQWMSELEVDDPAVVHECHLKAVEDYFGNYLCTNQHSSSEVVAKDSQTETLQPAKVVTNNEFSSYTSSQNAGHHHQKACSPPSGEIVSFGNLNSPPVNMNDLRETLLCNPVNNQMIMMPPISLGSTEELYGALEFGTPIERIGTRTAPLETQYHASAERKRRERITELFITLSSIIPGLKKKDKASVLGGAISHLKQLQERIKVLEEENKKRHGKSDLAFIKRPRLSSCDLSATSSLDQSLPEIEVRTRDGNVLLGVYCKKRIGIIKDILCEVEKLPLSIMSTSVIPFGNTIHHITIIAQEDGEFCMTAQDLANNIRRTITMLV